jgi:hypothetical protein
MLSADNMDLLLEGACVVIYNILVSEKGNTLR